jgi:muramoyltetrapeptide carboxypeptidase
MSELLRPPALCAGDTVGIVSPASPVASFVPRRLARGAAELERRGLHVRLGEYASARTGHTAGTIEQRLADLHAFFADDEVRAVVCTIGGYNSHALLEGLDFDLIAAHPKVFCGFSDITALHAGIHTRTGLVTFYGPALLPDWAEFGGLPEYTWEQWQRVAMRTEAAGEIPISATWTAEVTRWDEADDRLRVLQPNPGVRTIRGGVAEGRLAPVHASTLLLLAGTPWWPQLDGAVLAVEFAEEDAEAGFVDRFFTQLRHLGTYGRLAGVAIGRHHPAGALSEDALGEIVVRATRGCDLPVAAGFDFGHTEPRCTLPWGVRARLDADAPSLALLEPAVV